MTSKTQLKPPPPLPLLFASKALTLTPGAIYTVAPPLAQSPLALPAAPPPDRPASPLLPHALKVKTRLLANRVSRVPSGHGAGYA